jgi:hypothetical protein
MNDKAEIFRTADAETTEIVGGSSTTESDTPPAVELRSRGQDSHGRNDRGRLHAVRSSALSRGVLETLRRHGENIRALRENQNELRATLKPTGAIGRLLLDRFWASVLRLILVARLEEIGLGPRGSPTKSSESEPTVREGAVPILVLGSEEDMTGDDGSSERFDSELFRKLALVSRYDRAASREMYRTLSLLLLMRQKGEVGLESWASAMAGIKSADQGEDHNG